MFICKHISFDCPLEERPKSPCPEKGYRVISSMVMDCFRFSVFLRFPKPLTRSGGLVWKTFIVRCKLQVERGTTDEKRDRKTNLVLDTVSFGWFDPRPWRTAQPRRYVGEIAKGRQVWFTDSFTDSSYCLLPNPQMCLLSILLNYFLSRWKTKKYV